MLQMTSLDALAQIWWDLGEKSSEIKQKMRIEVIQHIWFLLGNPHKHHIPESQIQKQFLQVRYEFIENMRDWFATNGDNGSVSGV